MKEVLLSLVRNGLTEAGKINNLSEQDWIDLIDFSAMQGVLSIAFDGLQNIPRDLYPEMDTLMDWIGQNLNNEKEYPKHKDVIRSLASLFAGNGISMVLLKGYGLSLNYPRPDHRPTGDVDVYLVRQDTFKGLSGVIPVGESGDDLIKSLGIEVKQNEDKHSNFSYRGYLVENHASFVADVIHPCLNIVEEFLESNLSIVKDEETGAYLPSAMFNAVFLPIHTGTHFVHGEANLRQLLDWALFVKAADEKDWDIDWVTVERLAQVSGYFPFLCCMNGIAIDKLGFSPDIFPDWPRDKELEEKVLDEIFSSKPADPNMSLFAKFKRFFASRWKYDLVYNDPMFLTFFRLAKSYIRSEVRTNGKSIWKTR